jgi:hypothetical protein
MMTTEISDVVIAKPRLRRVEDNAPILVMIKAAVRVR